MPQKWTSFLQILFSAICFLTFRVTSLSPPLFSDDPDVFEVKALIESFTRGTRYSVVFCHVPTSVSAEDIVVKVLANTTLKFKIRGTDIDWYFKLVQPLPLGIRLLLPIQTERRPGDFTGAVWKATTIVPHDLRKLETENKPVMDIHTEATSKSRSRISPTVKALPPTSPTIRTGEPLEPSPRESQERTHPTAPQSYRRKEGINQISTESEHPLPLFDN